MSASHPSDTLRRPLKDLRISVTDRCNYRCHYCMPLEEYDWLARGELLSFEEITRLARLFLDLGVEKIRLTGGEPLLRKDLEALIAQLAAFDGLKDLALTSNGSGLETRAVRLRDAGLKRINISLDSLRPERFAQITKRGRLDDVLGSISAAKAAGLDPVKINAVIIRGVNDDEIVDLVEFARRGGLGIRFIEYMDVGNANNWSATRTVPESEILAQIRSHYMDAGVLTEKGRQGGHAPAVDYAFDASSDAARALGSDQTLGVIASVSKPFCGSCTRARLTADGKFVTCLFASDGFDLKGPLRGGASDAELTQLIRGVWEQRSDRYSEQRLEAMANGGDYQRGRVQKIEMIRLGG